MPIPTKDMKTSMIDVQSKSLDSNSCFPWFIVTGKTSLRNLVPDYEIKRCKAVFNEVLTKGSDIPEAHFGLGKLHAHEGKYKHALLSIKLASAKASKDPLYTTWQAVMLIFESSKNLAKTEALESLRLLEGER